jgi:hypothetical protein
MIDTRIEVSDQFIASGLDGLTYVVLEYTEYGNAATDKDAPENPRSDPLLAVWSMDEVPSAPRPSVTRGIPSLTYLHLSIQLYAAGTATSNMLAGSPSHQSTALFAVAEGNATPAHAPTGSRPLSTRSSTMAECLLR